MGGFDIAVSSPRIRSGLQQAHAGIQLRRSGVRRTIQVLESEMIMPAKSWALPVVATLVFFTVPPIFAQDADSVENAPAQHPLTFPREISGDEGKVVVHTPQIDAWPNFESIEARVDRCMA